MVNIYIHIDLESEEPIYVQLQNQIIEGIAKNQLKPGETLPSVRSMASDLGINLHTVNKAYQFLKQDGFILIHRQKGVVINPEPLEMTDTHYDTLKKAVKPIIAKAICHHLKEDEFITLCRTLYTEFKEASDLNE